MCSRLSRLCISSEAEHTFGHILFPCGLFALPKDSWRDNAVNIPNTHLKKKNTYKATVFLNTKYVFFVERKKGSLLTVYSCILSDS